MDKIFPDHWSFMFGEIALYSFVILLATGIFLTLYYVPSLARDVSRRTCPSTANGSPRRSRPRSTSPSRCARVS
jgi:quinol-cytochrome oxidoreductase complex cytochrome b subunit